MLRAMKILMISDVYFPRINGVSTSIQTFRDTLGEHGIEVTLVAPDYPDTSANGADHEPIVRIPAQRVPFDPEDRLMKRGHLRRLPQRLHGRHFDLVHVQTPFVAHYAGLRLAAQRGIPCLTTYHTHFEEYFHHYLPLLPPPLTRLITRHLARSQCNALDAIVVPSAAMHSALIEYGVTRPIHVLPTGIPLEKFSQGDRAGFRRMHGIAPDEPVALYVGRVAHEKNLGFLLRAFKHALAMMPKGRAAPRLVIAGEGPALPGLRREAEVLGLTERVLFVGYLDRERELPSCYAAADLFAFSSKTETQGLVLLEAMAMGLPALGIPAMGAADILRPGCGGICAPDDVVGYGILMAELLLDRAQLARHGAAAREFAAEWAAPERARQLAGLYRQLAGRATIVS